MAELIPNQSIDLAITLLRSGKNQDAHLQVLKICAAVGNDAPALHRLGRRAHEAGAADLALYFLRSAIAIQPGLSAAHHCIGIILRDRGQIAEALAAFVCARSLDPNNPEYLYNLATMLRATGSFRGALEVLTQLIEKMPGLAVAHYEMGRVLEALEDVPGAITSYQRSVALDPRFFPALHYLGIALGSLGQFSDAITSLSRASQQAPSDGMIQVNLAHALHATGNHPGAIEAYQRAVQLRPADSEPLWRLGAVLAGLDRLDEAIVCLQKAIALDPVRAAPYRHLARSVVQLGRADDAIAILRQGIARQPDDVDSHIELAYALQMSDQVSCEQVLREHRQFAERFADPLSGRIPRHVNDRSTGRTLRVGYASPDLRAHPVAMFLLPILQTHDRQQVDVTCYCDSWVNDEMTSRIRSATQRWRVTAGMSDEKLAAQIIDDRIDILVDLAQLTGGKRVLLFAQKPAPVQLTYLGYPGTTGLRTFDARLSDPYIDPPGDTAALYSEPTVRLPETYWCFRAIDEAPLLQPLSALDSGHITFGSLNKLAKVSPSTLGAWSGILNALPSSRLILNAPPGNARQYILNFFTSQRIDPHRIELVARQSFADYLATYNRMDIALDTFPFNGGTTTCQALWMGTPVVSLAGKAGVQRSGVSLLSNAGLASLVANTPEHYVRLAIELASDISRLSQIRLSMRDRLQASPLMAVPRFCENLEAAYRTLWGNWCTTSA